MPSPILFNTHKHHLGALRGWIEAGDPSTLSSVILSLGASQMDLYTGRLSVNEIEAETLDFLMAHSYLEKGRFSSWVNANEGFREIELSDASIWILRKGHEAVQYVHLHPGRYSPHTVRVRAGALKTALGILMIQREGPPFDINTKTVNEIRREYLNLSPVKEVDPEGPVMEMIRLLVSQDTP